MTTPATTAATTTPAATTKSAESRAKLSQTYDQFLRLLVTQMQNQDPLNPMDSAQFTNQLVSFSQVEQQISANDKLDKLLSAQTGNQTQSALGYIGLMVERQSNRVILGQNGQGARFGYDLAAPASQIQVTVKDANGKTVRVFAGEKTPGAHRIDWDGKDQSGAALAPGEYKLSLTAIGADGQAVAAQSFTELPITGVETVDGAPALVGANETVALSAIMAARRPASNE